LVDQNSRLRAEVERLEHELTQAKTEVVVRDAEVEKLSAEVARQRHELDEARRAAKRQAAPFSKGDRKRSSTDVQATWA
jgi:predicted  nucleic acid-binding Zn-ribbon protein